MPFSHAKYNYHQVNGPKVLTYPNMNFKLQGYDLGPKLLKMVKDEGKVKGRRRVLLGLQLHKVEYNLWVGLARMH